jgi:hypothetical protein
MKSALLTFGLLLVLTACGPSPEQRATLTATTQTATAAAWTATSIPTAIATHFLTATVFLTPTPIPTLTGTQTTVILQPTERIEFSMLSPDGTKIIQTKDWVTFDIRNTTDEHVVWSFSYDRAKFEKDNMYLSEAGYAPFYWSQNGKYIYVKAHQGLDGGVKYWGNVFGAEQGLSRFDVDTGIMTEILHENFSGGYTFAISPDESGIVYVDQLETPLVLRWRDLLTTKEKTLKVFDKQIYDVGSFGWSPKMDKLIFTTLEIPNPDQQNPEFLFDFFVIGLENLQQQTVFQGFDNWLRFELWNKQNQVFYIDWQNTVWQLDLDSKMFSSKGTATPSP